MLENARIAFIEKDPENILRVLGEVTDTDEPTLLNKELAKLFSPEVSGGAVGEVQVFNDMNIENIRRLDSPESFSTTISGSASISAKHWGHIDLRQVKFQLLLDLIEVNNEWQLADLTVIDLKEQN